ncbi:MAG: sulfite exporter TauE/SafE family protein [Betaproteobacteria bacterium]
MAIDPVELAALAAAAFAGSVIFGVTGFGAALVTVPFATHFVPLPFALALFVLMDLANAFRLGFENPKNAVRTEWTRMVPAILIGTVAGVTLLVNLPRAAATLALGIFVLLFAVYSLASSGETRRIVSTRWAYLAGFTGGVTSTIFGAGGPPYAIYLSHRGLAKEQYRATMGFATLTSISLRTIAFFATGILLDAKVWIYAIVIVPAGLAGLWAAGHLFRRISRDALMRAVALMLLASGASLIVRALN